MIVIFTDYFFLDFVIPGVKYNIYGLRRFADNQTALLFYSILLWLKYKKPATQSSQAIHFFLNPIDYLLVASC